MPVIPITCKPTKNTSVCAPMTDTSNGVTTMPNRHPIKWVPCYCTDRYEVSNHGFVRNAKTKRVLKPYILKGYFRISLRLSPGAKAKKKNFLINRLVLLSFIGEHEDPEKRFCAHLNHNSLDNQLENLAWKDWYGNFDDKVANGTASRLTEDEVALIRNNYANGKSQKWLAKRYGVHPGHISNIVLGHRWSRTQ